MYTSIINNIDMNHLINTGNEQTERLEMVRMVRLELTRLAALEPKSSVYTNFTTSALNQKNGVDDGA